MKKLLLYLILAVVTSLSALPRAAKADPYECEFCWVPFDIRNTLYGMMYDERRLDNPYSFTGDISGNNEAAWDAVVWTDGLRSKPTWDEVRAEFIHDYGAQYRTMGVYLYDAGSSVKGDIDILTADVMALETAVGGLPTPTEWSDLETAVSGKMNTPAGSTAQYVRGDGSLATFPTEAPAHTHATADVTSGTFADARIAQSNVTQHQAALSIGSSQVTGTKTSAFISDFAESAQDNVLGVVTAGNGLSYTYNDAGNAASISLASKTYQTPTFNSATTATQLSTTVEADVFYAFDATVTISLLAGQSVTAVLKYADDSGMSSNVVTVDSAKTANSGVLNLTQTNTLRVGGKIPAGKYRQVTFVTAGSGVAAPSAIAAGQEAF